MPSSAGGADLGAKPPIASPINSTAPEPSDTPLILISPITYPNATVRNSVKSGWVSRKVLTVSMAMSFHTQEQGCSGK